MSGKAPAWRSDHARANDRGRPFALWSLRITVIDSAIAGGRRERLCLETRARRPATAISTDDAVSAAARAVDVVRFFGGNTTPCAIRALIHRASRLNMALARKKTWQRHKKRQYVFELARRSGPQTATNLGPVKMRQRCGWVFVKHVLAKKATYEKARKWPFCVVRSLSVPSRNLKSRRFCRVSTENRCQSIVGRRPS